MNRREERYMESAYKNLTRPCRGCVYLNSYLSMCDYASITGKLRSTVCRPGKLCTVGVDKRGNPIKHNRAKPEPKHKRSTVERIAVVKRLWEEGKTDEQIADAVGLQACRIKQIRNEIGLKQNYPFDETEALRLHNAGYTAGKIAATLNVSVNYIRWWRKKNGLTKEDGN